MSKERRIHSRSEIPGKVQIKYQDGRVQTLSVRNLSDGGLLLDTVLEHANPVGTTVEVQFIGMEEAGPKVTMQVVRLDGQGLALKYV